ncbi:MAG: SGNH/GDSL hydrolase family protein [Myxococcales bacterium]|nr:SGNH/GDSL hydrolase family protein [Myxococcales bacterium]
MRSARGLALLLSSALCVLVAEGALRLAWSNPYAGETDYLVRLRRHYGDKQRVYDRSAIDPAHPRVALATDARGYLRGAARGDGPPDPTALRIAFLGGSTTECTALDAEVRFPALVEAGLRARGIPAVAWNAAVSGNNLHDSLHVLLDHVVADAPDVVLVMHATNDTGVLATADGYASSMGVPLDARVAVRWLETVASRSSFVVAFARHRLAAYALVPQPLAADVAARETGPGAAAIPVAPFARRLRAFVGVARAFDIEPVLATQPLAATQNALTPAWANVGAQARFNEATRAVGAETGALVVDLDAAVRASGADWDAPMHLFYDGMHVTAEGSRLYARTIVDSLAPRLRARHRSREEP